MSGRRLEPPTSRFAPSVSVLLLLACPSQDSQLSNGSCLKGLKIEGTSHETKIGFRRESKSSNRLRQVRCQANEVDSCEYIQNNVHLYMSVCMSACMYVRMHVSKLRKLRIDHFNHPGSLAGGYSLPERRWQKVFAHTVRDPTVPRGRHAWILVRCRASFV